VRRFRLRLPVKCSELRSLRSKTGSWRSRSGRLSGLLSGCPPTDTRLQARAKLGEGAISLYCDPLQDLSNTKMKKLLPLRSRALSRVASRGDQATELGPYLRLANERVQRSYDDLEASRSTLPAGVPLLRPMSWILSGERASPRRPARSGEGAKAALPFPGCGGLVVPVRRPTIAWPQRFWLYPRHFPPAGATTGAAASGAESMARHAHQTGV